VLEGGRDASNGRRLGPRSLRRLRRGVRGGVIAATSASHAYSGHPWTTSSSGASGLCCCSAPPRSSCSRPWSRWPSGGHVPSPAASPLPRQPLMWRWCCRSSPSASRGFGSVSVCPAVLNSGTSSRSATWLAPSTGDLGALAPPLSGSWATSCCSSPGASYSPSGSDPVVAEPARGVPRDLGGRRTVAGGHRDGAVIGRHGHPGQHGRRAGRVCARAGRGQAIGSAAIQRAGVANAIA
jgi:hypothetical protein